MAAIRVADGGASLFRERMAVGGGQLKLMLGVHGLFLHRNAAAVMALFLTNSSARLDKRT